jgi:hypothetical protein
MVFDETCSRCGHPMEGSEITASTWRLALAISEVMLGHRRVGTTKGESENSRKGGG